MADKLAIMAELNRRGKLPPDKAALFNEAVKRGLVPGSQGSADTPPVGAVPGSRAYADWAATRARGGNVLPQVSPPPPQQQTQGPNLGQAALATVNGITGSIPFLQEGSDALIAGGQTGMDALTGKPADFGARYNDIRASRDRIAQAAPLSNTLGNIGGSIGATALMGATPAGAEALGMTGSWIQQLANSALSTAGIQGLSGLSKGHTGTQLLTDEGIGFGTGAAGSLLGQGLNKAGEKISNTVTNMAQNRLTKQAIQNAPAASDLFDAGSQLFGSSVNGKAPLAVSDNAYMRLMGDIQDATQKFRPNAANDPKAVGLLQHMTELADAANTPGQVVDLKDLHLARQLATKVAQSKDGRDAAIGSIVINKIDDFVKGLKTADILGGSDPKQAANDLLRGISTWHKASKVAMIEDAIKMADTYKSGTEMGLKNSFTALMKTPEYQNNIFSQAEKQAIREVAKGTTGQNAMALLGRAGFSLGGGGGHNIIGGTLGAGLGTAALTPFLGPLAPIASLGASMGASGYGRAMADKIAMANAEKAAQVMATNSIIPVAKQAPNLLGKANIPIQVLLRGGALAATR